MVPQSITALLSTVVGARATSALVLLTIYLATCRVLRFRRRDKMHAKYPYKTREDMSKMTAEHAWEIVKYVMTLEFPFTGEKALQFALFRTYGIPTISKLLCETRQLSEQKNAPRRYADTSTLIAEFVAHSPTSERANSAIGRMNFLHGMYQRRGKISNDDMLYTLSLFVLEVERWINSYEWRSLTEMEVCALATLWKSIGDAMSISYEPLSADPSALTHGLDFVSALRTWSTAYEKRVMVPDRYNHQLAEETTSILLCTMPEFAKPLGRQAVAALMDDRLRKAMIYPKPPPLISTLTPMLLRLRRAFIYHLLPPRPYILRFRTLSENPDPKTGRYHLIAYNAEPWYIKNNFWNRNLAPAAWLRWALGRPWPGTKKGGKGFKEEGYLIMEVGPESLEKAGREECERTKERLMSGGRGGCPFAVG